MKKKKDLGKDSRKKTPDKKKSLTCFTDEKANFEKLSS